MNSNGIAVAGTLICDQYYMIDTYPKLGHLTSIRKMEQGVGGLGNLILDLAKLDPSLPIRVSAIVGTGSNGRYVMDTLRKYPNIDISGIRKQGHTSTTLVMEALDSEQRTFFYLPAASDEYDENVINWENFHADIFHLEYLLLMKKVDAPDSIYGTHGAKILYEARRRGMKTSIDMVSENTPRVANIVRAALAYTDYCTINELEAEAVTGILLTKGDCLVAENVPLALKQLAVYGVTTWAVIHTRYQSFGLDCKTGTFVNVSGFMLPPGYIKTATGAGDAFCCGVLYSAYCGFSLEEALRLGSACAACSLSDIGGSAGMRDYTGVLEVAAKYPVYGDTDTE